MSFKQHQIFVLNRDINTVIIKGMKGDILEVLDSNTYEVEFVKEDGTNYQYQGQFTFTLKKADISEANNYS
jgi:hypothetical protein